MFVDLVGQDLTALDLNDAVRHGRQCRVVGDDDDGAARLAAGALDYKTGKQVLALLQALLLRLQKAAVMGDWKVGVCSLNEG